MASPTRSTAHFGHTPVHRGSPNFCGPPAVAVNTPVHASVQPQSQLRAYNNLALHQQGLQSQVMAHNSPALRQQQGPFLFYPEPCHMSQDVDAVPQEGTFNTPSAGVGRPAPVERLQATSRALVPVAVGTPRALVPVAVEHVSYDYDSASSRWAVVNDFEHISDMFYENVTSSWGDLVETLASVPVSSADLHDEIHQEEQFHDVRQQAISVERGNMVRGQHNACPPCTD